MHRLSIAFLNMNNDNEEGSGYLPQSLKKGVYCGPQPKVNTTEIVSLEDGRVYGDI